MKFSVLQENLHRSLQLVQRTIPSKPSLPILSSLHLTAQEDQLTIATTDLFIGIKTNLGVSVITPGVIVVPGKLLCEMVAALDAGKLEFSLNETTLTMKSISGTTTIQCQSADDYPAFPEINGQKLTLEWSVLDDFTDSVQFAVSSDVTRPVLTAALFEFSQKVMTVVGTDGFRLAIADFAAVSGLSDQRLLIPSRSLSEIQRITKSLSPTQSHLQITYSSEQKQLLFVIENTQVYVRLIDGEYPPYQKIIPTSFSAELEVSAAELLQHLKRAMIFGRDSSNIIHFELVADELIVSATSATAGTHQSRMLVTYHQFSEAKIAFNAKYLQDFLTAVKNGTIVFQMSESLKPALFSVVGRPGYRYIVMPFRVTE